MRNARLLVVPGPLAIGLACLAGHTAGAQCNPFNVPLMNATASWSQDCGATFTPGRTIDGQPSTSWATVRCTPPGDRSLTESAVYETQQDLVASSTPIEITFKIFSGGYSPDQGGGNLTLGQFRLSYTTDERTQFADGRATGGLMGENWVTMIPDEVSGRWADTVGNPLPPNRLQDPDLRIVGDGIVLVEGPNPEYAVYTVKYTVRDVTIRGFRLDVVDSNDSDQSDADGLPTGGPGRHANGNLFIREMAMGQVRVPTITAEPQDGRICSGGTLTLSVGIDGQGPFSYQWRRGGQAISGATGSTYVLDSGDDAGSYDVVVSSPCGNRTSRTAVITATCAADFNCDGFVDFFDYDGFVEAYQAGTLTADCEEDGFIDFFDYDCFVAAYEVGC
jgi:hypothetical protein